MVAPSFRDSDNLSESVACPLILARSSKNRQSAQDHSRSHVHCIPVSNEQLTSPTELAIRVHVLTTLTPALPPGEGEQVEERKT